MEFLVELGAPVELVRCVVQRWWLSAEIATGFVFSGTQKNNEKITHGDTWSRPSFGPLHGFRENNCNGLPLYFDAFRRWVLLALEGWINSLVIFEVSINNADTSTYNTLEAWYET